MGSYWKVLDCLWFPAWELEGRNSAFPSGSKPRIAFPRYVEGQGWTALTIVSTSWGVLVAHHLKAKAVGEALASHDIEYFIPRIETLSIVRKRHVRELRPLLGDYVLTSITAEWKSMSRIRDVHGIIMNCNGFPAQVLQSEMLRLRDSCNDEGVYQESVIEDSPGFEYGQRVSPKTGPFACHIGRFDKRTKRGDDALFTLFGREQRVSFKSGDLLAV